MATSEFERTIDKKINGKYGSPVLSIMEIVTKHSMFLSSSEPKRLIKSTVHRYANQGLTGVSPVRSCRLIKIPLVFQKVMDLHCRMVQNSIGMLFIYLYRINIS